MFIDEHELTVRAGRGGDGCVSFRREKYIPKGGPDGGDGGRGGNVIFEASQHLHGLAHLQQLRLVKAQNGRPGEGSLRHGKSGKDEVVKVPVGTVIFELAANDGDPSEPSDEELDLANAPEEAFSSEGASGEDYEEPEVEHQAVKVADLDEPGATFTVATGGRGGKGNKRFATATNQAPRENSLGTSGEEKRLRLEVKLIADVGLVGLPNAGKSTLLSRVSRAKPKVAGYPFTTLSPCLGIVGLNNETRFVMADIPGLIEGASDGKGLGHQFLRHVERTRVLLHVIDASTKSVEELVDDFNVIEGELATFSSELAGKPRLVAVNKADVAGVDERAKELSDALGIGVHVISGVSGQGVQELLWAIYHIVKEQKSATES